MIKRLTLITFLAVAGLQAFAQEVLSDVDSLKLKVEKLESDMKTANKLKISGYIQAQYQVADSTGVFTYAAGNATAGVDKRFIIRRGRVKFAYDGNLTQFVLTLDATEGNANTVFIRDAYAKFTEPLLKTFSLQAGVMNRPFGYEVGYSSSLRETPERGRMSQIIFPEERDLGMQIVVEPQKTSPLHFMKIEAGFFNGVDSKGLKGDIDKQKDFIGHIILKKTLFEERVKISGGFSYYIGGVAAFSKYVYSTQTQLNGTKAVVLDSVTYKKGDLIQKREYFGADVQITIDNPFGLTTIRGEYIQGTQLGTASTTKSFEIIPTFDLIKKEGTHIRKFSGAYFYLIQDLGPTKHQAVLKADFYDPNTSVSGTNVSSSNKFTSADVKYTTIGLGYIYRYDTNVKFMLYYDNVKNESTSVTNFSRDLKDNIFTFRMQYKF